MFKFIMRKSDYNEDDFSGKATEEDSLKKARYRLLGVVVIFCAVLTCVPFLVKKPHKGNSDISIQLINQDSESSSSHNNQSKNKLFKKIKPQA